MNRTALIRAGRILVLLVFGFSTLPFADIGVEQQSGLREAIIQLQQLETTDEPGVDFRVVFTSAIASLQSAAGISTLLTQQKNSAENEKEQITVSVRLVYLLPTAGTLETGASSADLPSTGYLFVCNSHVISPELPPPISLMA